MIVVKKEKRIAMSTLKNVKSTQYTDFFPFSNFFIFQSFHLKWGYVYQPKTTHRGQNQHYCLLSSALRDKGRYSSVGFFGDVSLHVPTRDKDLAAYCTEQNWEYFWRRVTGFPLRSFVVVFSSFYFFSGFLFFSNFSSS